MNNIKLFMLLIMAATSSVAIADGEKQYEFLYEDEGNTLVISAEGDLTNYGVDTYAILYNGSGILNADGTHVTSVGGHRWNIPSGTYFYFFNPPGQVWSDKVTGRYVYKISYSAKKWTADKTSNYIYVAYYENGDWKYDYEVTGQPSYNDVEIYSNQTSGMVYVYSQSELSDRIWGRVLDTNSEVSFVPSGWITNTQCITISSDAKVANSAYNSDEENPKFEYNNQYCPFIDSPSELTKGQTYDISSLPSGASFISDMSDYHELSSTVYAIKYNDNDACYGVNTQTFTYNGQTCYKYATSDTDQATGNLLLNSLNLITDINDVYNKVEISSYTAGSNLYKSSGVNGEKSLLTNGTTYNYTRGDILWYYGPYTFKQDLLREIAENSYTKVVFRNRNSGTALTIDPEIVQIINFPNNSQNTDLTNLDLGKATLKLTGVEKFSDILENPGAANSYSNTLAEITLPLVEADEDESVTLPSNAIPVGYDNASAALRTVTVPVGYTKIAEKAFALARPGYTSGYGSAKITTINLPEGLKEIGDEAFYGITNLTNINKTDAEVAGRSIVFPSTVATIGESAFEACTSLTSTEEDPFILPDDLETIMPYAFLNLKKIKFLKLNSKLKFVGNSAFCCDAAVNDQTTIVFPASIAYLGPSAFGNRRYQDIYFTGTTAPVCPVGKGYYYDDQTAFYGELQMANNGFEPVGLHEGSHAGDTSQGYANRENYINNGCYFTMLHFPANISSDNAKTYKDITRKYVTNFVLNETTEEYKYAGYGSQMTLDVAQETDASVFQYHPPHGGAGYYTEIPAKTVNPGFIDTYLGEQCIWPSQSQWNRYYNLVANGYEWNGVDTYRPTVTDDMIAYMILDNLQIYNNSTNNRYDIVFGSKSYDTQTLYSDLTEDEKTALKAGYLSQILYQGTRRFVLSNDGSFPIPFDITMQGGMWWTICLPFNVTKKMVDAVFGVGTHVCLFSGVDRITTGDTKSLVLKFKNDVYQHKTVRTREEIISEGAIVGYKYNYGSDFSYSKAAPKDDDDVIMYAHESYMIYPTKNNEDPSAVRRFTDPIMVEGDPLPTKIQANASSDAPYAINAESGNPVYRFIGSYVTSAGGKDMNMKVPQYSYVFAKKKNDPQRKFYMYNGTTSKWVAFKSVVQNTAVGGGLEDWTNFFGSGAAKVNEVSLFGDEEEVTGIDNVIIEVSSDNDEDLRVFNLNGSQMGNSLQGLPAGTYIQGGKAYRVK